MEVKMRMNFSLVAPSISGNVRRSSGAERSIRVFQGKGVAVHCMHKGTFVEPEKSPVNLEVPLTSIQMEACISVCNMGGGFACL